MLRSLYSGVSGLKAHQTKMDVIGNNIANVNTTAFKASRVTFKDVYYQTIASATESISEEQGGTNPSQIGYGTAVSSVDVVSTRGGIQTTDKATDLYIDGDGYFVIKDKSGNISYTRNGNFTFDQSGQLVDANGNYVCSSEDGTIETATPIVIPDFESYSDISISKDGKITGVSGDTTSDPLGQIALAKFTNPAGLSQQNGIYFQETKNSGVPVLKNPGDQTGTVLSGELETSNVDLSKEMTDMITAERGFQANSRVISVSDEMLQELVNLKRQ